MTEPSARFRINGSARLPATWSLVAVLVAAHVASAALWVSDGHAGWLDALLFDRGTGFRIAVGGQHASALARGEWWRLATSVMLHGDALHLGLNSVALLALGRILEPNIGPIRWLGWFAMGGVLGSVASHLVGVVQSDGASGGAFALLAAAVWLGLRHRADWDPADQRLAGPVLGAFLALNLVLGCVLPGIDAIGHIGGGLVGLGLAIVDPVRRPWTWLYGAVAVAFAAACIGGALQL